MNLALAVDLELAKAVANGPEDDDSLRRKLWLGIAKHVVQGGAGGAAADGPEQAARIKMAVELLKEAGGWCRWRLELTAYSSIRSDWCCMHPIEAASVDLPQPAEEVEVGQIDKVIPLLPLPHQSLHS